MAFDSRETLMSTPLSDFKEPALLPNGHYYAQIMRNENAVVGEKNTDVIDFFCQLTEAAEDVDQSEIADRDLRETELRARFFITRNAMFRLKMFFYTLGYGTMITLDSGKKEIINQPPADSLVPEATGRKVLITVTTNSSTRQGRTRQFNNIEEIVGIPENVDDLGDSDGLIPVAETEGRRRRA